MAAWSSSDTAVLLASGVWDLYEGEFERAELAVARAAALEVRTGWWLAEELHVEDRLYRTMDGLRDEMQEKDTDTGTGGPGSGRTGVIATGRLEVSRGGSCQKLAERHVTEDGSLRGSNRDVDRSQKPQDNLKNG